MFPQASVSHSVQRGGGGGEYPWSQVMSRGMGVSRGMGTHPFLTWDHWGLPILLLLSPSGSHHTYGRHVGGTHPTGMLSSC